ncbi:BTB/POZ domain containing protein [Fragilaria crotonensis]|nr:BTB/POZ domain containing protein [Fragilaria crotonensis]
MESESIELSAYRYDGGRQQGLAPIESFDHTIATTPSTSAQFKQSVSFLYPPSRHESVAPITKVPASQNLTWRLDPDESLSDWTLTVVANPDLVEQPSDEGDDENDDSANDEKEEHRDDEQINPASPQRSQKRPPHLSSKKYFVHRTQLAVGPRRSEYFAKLFRQHSNRKKRSASGTRIELRPSAADAFPAMLDFLYCAVGTPPQVTTETAVALRHLATCFGIRELFDAVTEFIKGDLSPETSPTYLLEADTYGHDKLRSAALRACAQNFENIKFSRIVTLTPSLLEEVVTSSDLKVSSRILSARIASYCRCRPGMVDANMLQRLTRPDRMPEIAPEESLFFLHLISEVDEVCDDESLGGRRSGGQHSLYNRCLDASSNIVRVAVVSKEKGSKKKVSTPARNAAKEYHSLPPIMKVDLLEYALSKSPSMDDYRLLEQARQDAQKRHSDDSNQKLQQLQAEVEKMKRKYEKKLAAQEARIVAQEQEISAYAQELSRFVRVPNEYEIPDIKTEYTYASIPEFDNYGDSIYGQVPPTSLPRFGGRHGNDGMVLKEKRRLKNGVRETNCWPMFVYKGNNN